MGEFIDPAIERFALRQRRARQQGFIQHGEHGFARVRQVPRDVTSPRVIVPSATKMVLMLERNPALRLVFHHDPEQIKVGLSNEWRHNQNAIASIEPGQFSGAGFKTVSFTLFLNDLAPLPTTRGEQISTSGSIELLERWMTPGVTGARTQPHPDVLLFNGIAARPESGGVLFRCVITSLSYTISAATPVTFITGGRQFNLDRRTLRGVGITEAEIRQAEAAQFVQEHAGYFPTRASVDVTLQEQVGD